MVKRTVSIVIPNYNGSALLAKNLLEVKRAADFYDKNTEIIVVDDASTDNSIESFKKIVGFLRHSGEPLDFARDKLRDSRIGFWTSQNDENIKLITRNKNEGFSSSCNLGVRRAKGEIVILLNTDVRPEKNFLSYLLPHFNNPKVFAVGCLDKSWENGQEIERGRGIGWFKNGFLIHVRGEIKKTNTLWVSGGSSAYDKKKWQELGGFDQNFNPFYWEDIDLSYRAQKKGYKVLFEPKAVVHHNHEEGAIKSKYSQIQIKTIAYRNQFLFIWKNITDKDLIAKHLVLLPVYLLKALARRDKPFIKGLAKAIVRLPRLYYYRATVRGSSTKVISDKQILAPYLNES